MFKNCINSTPLCNDTANEFFDNIYGDACREDVTFLSTLRALVYPRMSEGEKLKVSFMRTTYTAGNLQGINVTSGIRAICSYFSSEDSGSIYIHTFASRKEEDNIACMELMKKGFCEAYQGWHMLEKVTDFYRNKFDVVCFINPEIKSVALFVDDMDMSRLHYLQCSIFAILPWYFDPSVGVSELEMELITSLREKKSTKYEEVLDKIAATYDFRTMKIKKLLAGFETSYERIRCHDLKIDIDSDISDINYFSSQIGEKLKHKLSLEEELLGLETKIANSSTEESEIMEYFLCNDKLVLLNVTTNNIQFGVKTNLEYFDEEMVRFILENKNSYIYRPDGADGERYIPHDSIEKLIKAIFIDQSLKLNVCAVYDFNLRGSVRAISDYHYTGEFRDYMPNPHINGYACLGNYQMTINELLVKRDYITAIEQCVASCKSLNFGDSPVMTLFSKVIYGLSGYTHINNRCIELPDGKVVKPKEAIEWLNSQEVENNG